MRPLLTRQAARAVDVDAVERLGLPSVVLMENAGRGAADAIVERFSRAARSGGSDLRVLVAGGPGQNGGDGWVVARHLASRGLPVVAVLLAPESKLQGDAAPNFAVLRALGVRVVDCSSGVSALRDELADTDVVVDALFGIGLDRALSGRYAEAIVAVNAADAPRVALDLPSGVDADTGQILGAAVEAQLTVTFGSHKRGLFQYPGRAHAGDIVLVPLGVPDPEQPQGATSWLLERQDVAPAFARRPLDHHKGRGGRVLVLAGSPGRTGAALLAGRAALRAGAGLVTLAGRAGAREALDNKVIELMTEDLAEDFDAARHHARRLAADRDAVALGPGWGLDDVGRKLACELSLEVERPLVLDADALTALGDLGLDALQTARGPRVLTPHPAEAARLLERSTVEIQADRYRAAQSLAERSGHVVVLKGAGTVVSEPGGTLWVCPFGTPALGAAGTGDVLTGIMAALLAHCPVEMAARVAVVVHALAGERAAVADRGLLAGEVADALPEVIATLQQGDLDTLS